MQHPENSGYHPLDVAILLKGMNAVMELAFRHSDYPHYVLEELLENGGLEEIVRRINAHDDTSTVTVREVIQIMDEVIAEGAAFAPDAPAEEEEPFFPRRDSEQAVDFPEPVLREASQDARTERQLLQQIEGVLIAWKAGDRSDTKAIQEIKKYLVTHVFLSLNIAMSEVGATVTSKSNEERDTTTRA